MRQEDKVLNYLKSTGKALSGRESRRPVPCPRSAEAHQCAAA